MMYDAWWDSDKYYKKYGNYYRSQSKFWINKEIRLG